MQAVALNERHLKKTSGGLSSLLSRRSHASGIKEANPRVADGIHRDGVRFFHTRDSVACTIATNVLHNSILWILAF